MIQSVKVIMHLLKPALFYTKLGELAVWQNQLIVVIMCHQLNVIELKTPILMIVLGIQLIASASLIHNFKVHAQPLQAHKFNVNLLEKVVPTQQVLQNQMLAHFLVL